MRRIGGSAAPWRQASVRSARGGEGGRRDGVGPGGVAVDLHQRGLRRARRPVAHDLRAVARHRRGARLQAPEPHLAARPARRAVEYADRDGPAAFRSAAGLDCLRTWHSAPATTKCCSCAVSIRDPVRPGVNSSAWTRTATAWTTTSRCSSAASGTSRPSRRSRGMRVSTRSWPARRREAASSWPGGAPVPATVFRVPRDAPIDEAIRRIASRLDVRNP